MKLTRILASFVAILTTGLGETALSLKAPVEPSSEILASADANGAWKAISNAEDRAAAAHAPGDATERARARLTQAQEQLSRNLAFVQRYPTDPRRWTAIMEMDQLSFSVANPDGTPKPPFDSIANLSWTATEWAAWLPQIRALKNEILTAPDASAQLKFMVEMQRPGGFFETVPALSAERKKGGTPNYRLLVDELLRLSKLYPDVPQLGGYMRAYLEMRSENNPTAELDVELKELAADENNQIRSAAESILGKRAKLARPLEIAFTAADGRKVDLKDLRGKVVLVDFWATWCEPCKEEIPTIKKVYAAYHDQGFEVIGISLENGQLKPTDTPEQAAAKLEKAKKVLTDFTAENDMPWPQYFDGKFWQNDLARRYEINAIPAMLLIDQDGKLVTTNARGEKLEAEVKRLLKL